MAAANNPLKWACIVVCVLLFQFKSEAQNVVIGEYFFDEDPGIGQGIELLVSPATSQDITFNASVGSLAPGYHDINIRFKDAEGKWGIARTTLFYINGPIQQLPPLASLVSIIRGEYFWGSDPGPGNGQPLNLPIAESFNLAATIEVPFNTQSNILSVRFQDLSGTWGVARQFEANLVDSDLGQSATQNFIFSPDPATAGGNINFTDQSSGFDIDALIQWDVNGDNIPDYFGSNFQHSFSTNGIYPVRQVIVNESSDLSASADAQFYFRNGSLADEAGTFSNLSNASGTSLIDGRAGDALGARSIAPNILKATSNGQLVDAFSVAFWVRGEEYEQILQIGDSTGILFRAFASETEHSLAGITVLAGSLTNLYDGLWHHVGFRYGAGLAESFLDGALIQARPVNLNFPLMLNSLKIGVINATQSTDGFLDDLTFYKRKLTNSEMQILANEAYATALIKNVQVGLIPEYEIGVAGNTTLCDGEVAILSAPSASAYLWNNGQTTQNILVQEAGNYICQLTIAGQLAITNSVEIEVLPRPAVVLSTNDASNGQSNGSASVTVSGGNSFVYGYAWSNSTNLPIAQNLAPGQYSVNVSDGLCPVDVNFQIFNSIPVDSPRIVAGEYFFGADPGVGEGSPLTIPQGADIGVFAGIVPPSSVLAGSSPLMSFRFKDNEGKWGVSRSRRVFIIEDDSPQNENPGNLIIAEYFFDDIDPGVGQANTLPALTPAINVNFGASIPTTGLGIGPHVLHLRVKDDEGEWGIERTEAFSIEFIIPPSLPNQLLTLVEAEYFIGNLDPGPGNATPVTIPPGDAYDLPRTIDVSDLIESTYTVSFRTRDITGQWSTTKTRTFEIVPVTCEVPNVDFSFNLAQAGQSLNLTNLSTNVTGQTLYAWDIGADGSSEFTSFNATTIFASPGVYDIKLTVNNGGECSASLVQQVVIGPVLSTEIIVNGSTEFCLGNSVLLTAPAGTNYVWSTLESTQTIDVSAAGYYSCTYTDANGNQAYSNSVGVTVNPLIDVVFDTSPSSNGAANGSAAVFATGGSSLIYSYLWSDGYESQVNTALGPGNYSVTVTDGFCPKTSNFSIANLSSGVLNLTRGEYFFGDDPGVGNGMPLLIPEIGSFDLYADITTSGQIPGYRYLSVRLKQSDGRWGIAKTIPVSLFDPAPTVIDLSPSTIVAAEYFLGIQDPGPGNATSTDFFTSDQTILASAIIETLALDLEPGPVKVSTRVKDAAGNWSFTESQDFFIQVEPAPNLSDIDWSIVEAEYFLGFIDPGPGLANSIDFNIGSDVGISESISLSGLPPGPKVLTIRVKDGNGKWSVAKTIPFNIAPVTCPVPSVNFTNSAANVGSISTLQNTSSNTLATASYSWDLNSDGLADASGQTAQLAVPNAGNYYVTLTVDNGNGCLASSTRNILIGPSFNNLITSGGSLNFCEGDSVILTAPSGSNYLWNNEQITQSIIVKESGAYSVSYANTLGTPSYANGIQVEVFPELNIETVVNSPTNGNANGSAGVLVTGGSQFVYNYDWSSGESSAIITAKAAGTYSVSISDLHCPETVTVDLVSFNTPVNLIQAEYFWNTDPGIGLGTSLSIPESNSIEFYAGIATDALEIGYHSLNVRVKRSSGVWGIAKTLPVYVGDPNPTVPPAPLAHIAQIEYYVDGDPGIGNGTLSFTSSAIEVQEVLELGVANLNPGSHTISTRVKNVNGEWGISRSSNFEICNPPPVPILVSASEDVCQGGSVTLKVTNLSFDITWITPEGLSILADSLVLEGVETSSGGIYQVFAQGEPGCFSARANFELTVLEPPTIGSLLEGSPAVCREDENAVLFISPVDFATSYQWQFSEDGIIVSGNNTNNISIDFSNGSFEQALIGLVVSNICGSDTASPFIQVFDCNDPCSINGQDGVLIGGECLLYDCNNILGGNAYADDCGICNSNPQDDNASCAVIVEGAIASLFICTDSEVRFELYQPGTTILVQSITGFIQSDGTFDFGVIATGNYDVFVKVEGYLNKGIPNISLQNMAEGIDFGTLTPGDFFSDNVINANDFTIFANVFFSTEGDSGYDSLYDLNCDGFINGVDFSLFVASFFMEGDSAPIQE